MGLHLSVVCKTCGAPVKPFRDELSEKEFFISGICQNCQDEIFAPTFKDNEFDAKRNITVLNWRYDWRWLGCLTDADYYNGSTFARCVPLNESVLHPSYPKQTFICVDCSEVLIGDDVPVDGVYIVWIPHTCTACWVTNAETVSTQSLF